MSVASVNEDKLSVHDHDKLLEAFVNQDADLALRETLHHLELVESTIVNSLADLR